jgi:hypothetical protein
LTGLWLPYWTAAVTVILILISFWSSTVSSVILADKLILLAMGFCPFVFALGVAACVVGLVRFENKAIMLIAVMSNTVVLALLVYFFLTPYLADLKVVI